MKSLAIKKETKVNLTTKKMLLFSKTSIQSFVYNLINVFTFPGDVVQKIYEKMKFKNWFFFQNLIDTDSTSLFFIFICKLLCYINERNCQKHNF